MSKLSFRARALDPTKPMPIYLAEELPDLPEYSAINRAVPQMPSGMEKEEESEHHLQRAICTGLIIPTPEVLETDSEFYDRNYPADYKMSRQLIHMQPLGLEQDIPDYDMDTADEAWVTSQTRRLDLNPLKFEQMMDRLEKSSGQTVVTLNEAKALLKQDDEVSIAVYDYWLNKRLKTQHPLLLTVRTENRAGAAPNNPYLAFRRRTEKMQTRKNRKNDEQSYEKMLKLRRDLSRAVTLLELIKRREKMKREQMHLGIDIFENRYHHKDFSGHMLTELTTHAVKSARSAFAPIYTNQYSQSSSVQSGVPQWSGNHHQFSATQYHSVTSGNMGVNSIAGVPGSGTISVGPSGGAGGAIISHNKRDMGDLNNSINSSSSRKEKRQYKKRKHKAQQRDKPYPSPGPAVEPTLLHMASSDEDEPLAASISGAIGGNVASGSMTGTSSTGATASNHLGHEIGEEEGLYQFRRARSCQYHKPLTNQIGNWPWTSKEENGSADPKYRFNLTSLRHQRRRCIGFARRRVGRGGRILLDRAATNMDDLWSSLDFTIFDSNAGSRLQKLEVKQEPEDSIVGDLVTVKSEVDSVVVDLVSTTAAASRKNSMDSVTTVGRTNVAQQLLSPFTWSGENNVIKSEQNTIVQVKQEILDDFYNYEATAMATPPPPPSSSSLTSFSNHRYSTSGSVVPVTPSSVPPPSLSPSSRRTLSQSNPYNSVSISNNISNSSSCSSNLNRNESVYRGSFSMSQSSQHQQLDPRTIKCEAIDPSDSDVIKHNELYLTTHSKSDEELYSEFISEIRRDWLHFRPKTPSTPTEDDKCDDFGQPSVQYTERTTLQVEIQRLGAELPSSTLCEHVDSGNVLLLPDDDNVFLTIPFSLNDLMMDVDPHQQSSTTPHDTLSSNSGNDLNISGDSLPELSLSLGENEDNEKLLENILQECQFDDLKSFNSNSNFWNGLLEDTGTLCDDIEEATVTSSTATTTEQSKRGSTSLDKLVPADFVESVGGDRHIRIGRRKGAQQQQRLQHIGCSAFTISNIPKEDFFKKEDPPPSRDMVDPHHSTIPCTASIATTITTPTTSTIIPTNTNQPELIRTSQPPSLIIADDRSMIHHQYHMQPIATTLPATQQIKIEPPDDILDTVKLVKSQNLPVVKTEVVYNATSTAAATAAAAIQQANAIIMQQQQQQIQQQQQQQIQHQQQHVQQKTYIIQQQHIQQQPQQQHQTIQIQSQSQQGEGTLILSAAPSTLRRQTNGPADKNAIQHLFTRASLVNRKFHIQQQQQQQLRMADNNSSSSIINITDDSDVKPKLLDGNPTTPNATTFIKMSPFSASTGGDYVVTAASANTNNLMAAVAANHNYSLAPHHQQQQQQHHPQQSQPITLIGQSPHNKFIINSAVQAGGSNIAIATPIQQVVQHQDLQPQKQSNVKVNLVATSLAQAMQQQQQSGLNISNVGDVDNTTTILSASSLQHQQHQLKQHLQQQQLHQHQHHHQSQQLHQQQVQPNRKTVNMLIDADKNRILYTNVKNNRGQPIFASLNPKVVNLLPMQNKNSAGVGAATVQSIVTPVTAILNKNQQQTVQRITTIGNAQTLSSIRQQQQQQQLTNMVSGGISVVGTSSGGVGNINASPGQQTSGIATGSSVGSGGAGITDSLTKIIQNSDGVGGTTVSTININTTNR